MKTHLLTLAKNALPIYGAQLLGLVVGFGLSIVVARTLGAEGRGVYGWVMSLYFIAIQFGQLGTDTLNRRLAAQKPEFAPALAGNSLLQAGTLGGLAALAVGLFGYAQPLGHAYPVPLALGMLGVPLAIGISTLTAVSIGIGHPRLLARTEILQRLVLVGTLGLVLATCTLHIWHLLAAQVASVGITLAFTVHKLRQKLPKWHLQPAIFRYEHKYITMAFGAGLAMQLMGKLDLLFLAAYRPLADSGHYAVAQTLLDAMMMLPGMFGFLILSMLAGEKNSHTRWQLLVTVTLAAMGVMGLACLLAGLLAPWFIPMLFGQGFGESVPVFQRLMVAGVFVAGFTIAQNAVAGTGRARYLALAPLAGVSVKVVLGWYLAQSGMLAMANATILAYAAALAVAMATALHHNRPQKYSLNP